MEEGWINVEKKVRKPFSPIVVSSSMEREEIFSFVEQFFTENEIAVSVVLYGSVTSSFRFNRESDVDIMIFLNQRMNKQDLIDIKRKLVEKIGRKVDLVAMLIKKKFQDPIFHNQIFYEQVREEGITVYGQDFKDFIEKSEKIIKI